MKNLLSMLAVSTLVGTSGSSLQPMFAQKIVNTVDGLHFIGH